jgi:glycosyltransferase involved in cell wall biosynthesis
MTETPLVSIVIPAYNQAAYLGEAIESVLAQDYPRVELIVLDDGSTDGTRGILQRYAGRFCFESHPNMGQAATLNKGWRMARGSVLSYLAADDRLAPRAASASVAVLLEHPDCVMTYVDYDLIDPASRFIRRVRTPDYDHRSLAVGLICAPGPGAFLRRSAFERAGPWNERLRQIPDFELWLRLAGEGCFRRISEALAAYRVHDASQSFAPVSAERAVEPVEVMREYFVLGRVPRELRDAQGEALSNAQVLAARLHLRSGRYADALRLLWAALRLHPGNFRRLRTWHLVANGLVNRFAHRALWVVRR